VTRIKKKKKIREGYLCKIGDSPIYTTIDKKCHSDPAG